MRNLLCLLILAIAPLLAHAEEEDAPGRVARLSLVQGEVSFAPAGTDEFADAVLNRPLTSGDRLWVDKDARAELQAGSVSAHLDQNSGFSFEELGDDVMRMKLTDGAATVRVRRKLDSETVIVETPNATVALLHPGEYHLEVNEAGDQTIVKVRSGEAAVTGEKDSFVVRAEESGRFKGEHELAADISRIDARTAFESWANDRDRREENSPSAKYVSRDVVGYEDLDEEGDWIDEPEYGYVWAPRRVYAGWAPYRDGRWAWVSPWGWTWVDNASWGFAPFHYGRWAYVSHRSRWCWVPGPRHLRPVYAPALVAWVGSPGVSVSVGIGSGVGWFPLGPREVYVPGYWHSRRYIHNVNVTNTVIVNNVYINDAYRGRRDRLDYRYRNRPDAVTVVSRDSFVGGRQIRANVTTVRADELRQWRQDARPPAIAPRRESVLIGNRVAPSRGINERFARADARESSRGRGNYNNPAGRVPFSAEQQAVEANGGRPVARSQIFPSGSKDSSAWRQGGSFTRGNVGSSTKNVDSQSDARNDASGSPPQWRSGGYRNRDSDAGRTAPIPHASSGSVHEMEAATSHDSRSERQTNRSDLAASGRLPGTTVNRDRNASAGDRGWSAAPAERAQRQQSSPAFETRAQRESRPAPRMETPREARQVERVQAAPARESSARSPQSAPQASGRGNQGSNDGGSGRGGKSSMNQGRFQDK